MSTSRSLKPVSDMDNSVNAACVPQAWESAVVPKTDILTNYKSRLLSPPLRRSPAPLTSA
jgi:hypothetical protein